MTARGLRSLTDESIAIPGAGGAAPRQLGLDRIDPCARSLEPRIARLCLTPGDPA